MTVTAPLFCPPRLTLFIVVVYVTFFPFYTGRRSAGLVLVTVSSVGTVLAGCDAPLTATFLIMMAMAIPICLVTYILGPMDIAPNYAGLFLPSSILYIIRLREAENPLVPCTSPFYSLLVFLPSVRYKYFPLL